MTNKSDIQILEMLASRICHDIISPVGAVNNGVEFLQEMGADALDEAMGLISYSASQAAAKLQAFRMAYGAGGKDPNIKPEDVQKAFSSLISGEGKISQTWDPFGPIGPDPLPPGFCKMLMGTMMLATETLPKGGTVSVRRSEDGYTHVIAEGQDATVREHVNEALARSIDPDDLDPRLVHPYAFSLIADLYDFSITIDKTEEKKIVFLIKFEGAAEEETQEDAA